MKRLYKKIGIVVLSGAILMGGVFASCKSFIYADNFNFNLYINKVSYELDFDVINDHYRGSPSDLREAASFLNDYGLYSVKQIQRIESINLKKENLKPGMYIVNFGYRVVLIGVH